MTAMPIKTGRPDEMAAVRDVSRRADRELLLVRPESAEGPEAAMGGAGLGFEPGELGGVAEVGGSGGCAGVALGNELGVDHDGTDPDVGEEATVAVAGFDVELDPDGSTSDEGGVDAGGGGTPGAPRRPGRPSRAWYETSGASIPM